ncbi:MAG: polyhydroxyalkanoic acid system family protein [Actinomycetota bacterium]
MAREFQVIVPHQLAAEEATRRIKMLLAELREIFGTQISEVDERWNGHLCDFRMKMFLFKIAGSINVGARSVEVKGKMPPGTGRYEPEVRSMIEQRARTLLAVRPDPGPPPLEPPSLAP